MRCGNWGKEPFDLRLTILRMIRCMPWILAIILVGTLAFGGGYYLKNVVLRGADTYTAKAEFLIDYTDIKWAENLKYVNEYSWNIWMQSDMLQDFIRAYLPEGASREAQLGDMLAATVPSDLRVLRIAVTSQDPAMSETVLEAVKKAMTTDFPPVMEDIDGIEVTDTQKAVMDIPDVRPLRAFVLAAVISAVFAIGLFLVRELTLEQIWLPTTLTDIYGLKNAGTLEMEEFAENLQHFLQNKKKVAVLPLEDMEDAKEFAAKAGGLKGQAERDYLVMPCPLKHPECAEQLREAEGVLLVVRSGADSKKLGLLLNFLGQQDVKVDAAVLWKADRMLVKNYYRLECMNKIGDRE